MTMRANDLTERLDAIYEKLPEAGGASKADDIGADIEELIEEIKSDGVESRPHVRSMVDVSAAQECQDQECSHEDECPTVSMAACLGCSPNPDEPNDDGMLWYTKWEMAEWKHHSDYFSECTPACLHGDQFGKPIVREPVDARSDITKEQA